MQRNNLRKIIMISAIAILAGNNVNAQAINQFTAKQAVDYGLKNAVQVKNALLDIQLQQQTNREITAAALPQISGSGSYTYYTQGPISLIPAQFVNPSAPAGEYVPVAFSTKYNSSAGVSLTQTIFDGQVFVGLKARSAAIALAQKNSEVTQEQIKANIYKIYYQLVVGVKQLATVQANIDRFDKLLHDTKEIYKNGFAEKLDIDKITVQLNNLQTQKLVIQNQLAGGNAGLKFLLNMPQKDSLVLTDTLSDENLKSGILDENYNYNDRKEMQVLSLNSKLYEYNIKRYQLSRIPNLTGNAGYSKATGGDKFNFISGEWYATSYVGLSLAVPIFDGFTRRAKIQEAKITLEKNKNNIEYLKQSIDNDVTQSRINMKNALATMDNQKQNTDLATNVFNSTKLKYDQGLGSNQEIYDAQNQLEVAQNNYYNAVYDAIIAKINYLQAVGKL
jgi:outer membrane protein